MNRRLRFRKIVCLTIIVAGVFLLWPGAGSADITPRGSEAEVLRFDAILELSAPIAGTHVMLCARYWVSPTHYSVAVVWAEPAEAALNFSTYPPTLQIDSNEQEFSLSNQLRPGNDTRFSKPLGQRGAFRNKFNNYPVEKIRFAEHEALASRIYVDDMEKLAAQAEDEWQTIDVGNCANQKGRDREVAKLDVRMSEGRMAALKITDANGQAIKSIEYEYSKHKGQWLLAKQNVLLPKRLLTVGYNNRGATVKIGNKEQTYKELPGSHHKGGRKCTVEYKPIKIANGVLPLPASITVHHGETNAVLRTARLSNFVQLKQTPKETEQAALEFSRFDDNELKMRELMNKYWQKDPDKIEDPDAMLLKQLRTHFENLDASTKTLGERLKRINMLMQLDWIQAHDALKEHFRQYLAVLTSNHLGEIVLAGGLHVINATIEWGQFSTADELLREWIRSATAICDAESILSFAQIQIRRRHYWPAAKLLEECSKPRQDWKQKRFDAQALRCISLWELSEMVKDPSKAKTDRSIAQAGFASWSLGAEGLWAAVRESMAEAKLFFAGLDEPTPRQKALRRQLEQMEAKVRRPITE